VGPKLPFWHTFLRAVETEVREAQTVRGASGFVHPLLAVGVDETRRRTVIISGESDARTAALAQADIQAALPSTKVVMARPVPVNLRVGAMLAREMAGTDLLPMSLFDSTDPETQEVVKKMVQRVFNEVKTSTDLSFKHVELNILSFAKEIVQQLAVLRIEQGGRLSLEPLMSFDPVAVDRAGGVCAVPLYELKEPDFETLVTGKVDDTRALLTQYGIFQYFFPPADQIALAVVEKGHGTTTAVVQHVEMAPEMGHPLAPNELVDPQARATELIDALKAKDLLVEGTVAVEVSPTGSAVRSEVRFRPREGALEKLSRVLRVRLDVNLKDFFK